MVRPTQHRHLFILGGLALVAAVAMTWQSMRPDRRLLALAGLTLLGFTTMRYVARRPRRDPVGEIEAAIDAAHRFRAEYARDQFPDIFRPRSAASHTPPHNATHATPVYRATTATPARAPRSSSSPASPSSPRLRIAPSPTPSGTASLSGAPPGAPQ